MLGRVLAIALNTYRESLRARILLGLAGVSFAISFYSIVVGAFTLQNAPRVVSDLGSASISLFSIAVAVVITATSLHRELEQKTLFPILARPITRAEYLVGKYFGTLLTIAVFILADAGVVLLISAALGGRPVATVMGAGVLSVVVFAVAAWRFPWARTFGPIPWAATLFLLGTSLSSVVANERRVVLGNSALAFLEVLIVAAVAMLFSSFSTPFLSALLTLGVWVIGREADMLAHFPARYFGQTMHVGAATLAKVVPNLHVYVPPRPLLTGEAVGAPLGSYFAMATIAAIAWAVGLLATASFVFRRRDFL